MGKRKRGVSGVRFTHNEMLGKTQQRSNAQEIIDDFQFNTCSLTYYPNEDSLFDEFGYAYSKEGAEKYFSENSVHPFKGIPYKMTDLIEAKFTEDENGDIIDPVTQEKLTTKNIIVMNKKNGNVYNYQSILQFNKLPNIWQDLITCDPFEESDLVVIHDPSRKLDLPPKPLVSFRKEVTETEAQRNARLLLGTFDIKHLTVKEEDKTWFLTRPNSESFALASQLSTNPPKQKSLVCLHTSLGNVILELDSDKTPMGVLNFLGHALRGSYDKAEVKKVDQGKFLEIASSAISDESVWGTPFSFERNEPRRGMRYQIYIVKKNKNISRISNTADFGISKEPLSIDQYHIIGCVKSGEGYVASIIDGKTLPNGRPVRPCTIYNVEVQANPFPATKQ